MNVRFATGCVSEIKKRQELQGQKRRLYERLNLSRTGDLQLLLAAFRRVWLLLLQLLVLGHVDASPVGAGTAVVVLLLMLLFGCLQRRSDAPSASR